MLERRPRTDDRSISPGTGGEFRIHVRGALNNGLSRDDTGIVFASAFPLYVVVEATGTTRFVAPVVVALWGLYWSVVYSAAKSGHAWRDEPLGPLPFFLRPFEEGMAKHPRLFAYPRLLAWLMRPLGSPATHGERSFGAFLGLVAVRALTFTWHRASCRVLQKVGMRVVGTEEHELMGEMLVFERRREPLSHSR